MAGRHSAPRCFVFAILLASLAGIVPSHSDDRAGLLRFLEANRCLIMERLDIIHAASGTGAANPYIVVSLAGEPQSYVQCLFLGDGSMLCEASSGYYAQLPGEPRKFQATPAALAALERLGFSTDDSVGNFQRLVDVNSPADVAPAADLILSALYFGYHAWPDTPLEIEAPLAPVAPAQSRCALMG